ncbi:MAG: hypothetical protein ACI80V_000068 [Rhodothermales bacterium]
MSGLGGSIIVDVDGTGYLSVFIDGAGEGSYATAGDRVVDDLAVVDGQNAVAFTVPTGLGVTGMRPRVCSAIDTCDTPVGLATDGEVEDYEVTLLAATAAVTLQLGGSAANVAVVGGNTVITDANGVVLFSGAQATIGALTITGGDNTAESVSIDPAAIPASGLTVALGDADGDPTTSDDPGDSMTLLAGTVANVTHFFDNATEGTVYIDAVLVDYTGLDRG